MGASLSEIERQLAVICRRAVQATLLAGSLGPLVGCSNAPQRRGAAPHPAASSADAATAARPPAKPDASAGAADEPPALPPIFAAESGPPIPPPAPSAQFVAFPCGTPPFAPGEQERIWNDEALYQRFARLRDDLEYDMRGRSLNMEPPTEYVVLQLAMEAQGGAIAGSRLWLYLAPLAEHGNACTGARDRVACEAELQRQADAVVAKERCNEQGCRPFYYVYAQTTRGSEVRTYVGRKGLKRLFGPIDTPTEAWFLLVAERIFEGLSCGDVGQAAYRSVADGHELRGLKYTSRCHPLTLKELTYHVDAKGEIRALGERVVSSEKEGCVVSGRRPPGLVPAAPQAQSLAGYLARAAHLEAASVRAFEALADELTALGAPSDLIDAVHAARRDEVDHAAHMSRLAARFGAARAPVQVASTPPRSRLELALDNAREGCVRELFGAFVARFQARRAQSPALREAQQTIATDELRHAALSWALADWLELELDPAQRQRVAEARSDALHELRGELTEPNAELSFAAGLPCLTESLLLVDAVARWTERATATAVC